MEQVFHHVKIDKNELKKVKQKAAQQKAKVVVETDDFIPFMMSEGEEEIVEKEIPAAEPKSEPLKSKEKPKEALMTKDSDPKPKRTRIETLLYKGMPWIDSKRRFSPNTSQRLHEEIVDFINWMGPTEEERKARQSCIDKVQNIVSVAWPDSVLEIFGSVKTQFYVPSSDIDLVIQQGRINPTGRPPLKKLANLLKKAGIPETGSIQVISKARVPIIKYIDRVTAYPVDISFNTITGTESADIISKYSFKYPALRPLTLLVKQFLEMRGLNEVYTGGIGSYTVSCLVLSFLQTHPLIQADLIRPHENLGIMLIEFFELYGRHFNYDQVGISVQPSLPGQFYFDKLEREWYNEARPGLLSVEDPQNSENDISKGSFSFHTVRQAFEHGFNVLVGAIAEFERLQVDHNRGRIKSSPAAFSILASAIRVSDGILRHRHYVKTTTIV